MALREIAAGILALTLLPILLLELRRKVREERQDAAARRWDA